MVINLLERKWWFADLVLRLGSFWVGVHWNKRRICIALIPCVVLKFERF
jgi:hypothetical protein